MNWIEKRVKAFVPLIEPLGVADEATIQQLCEQEIAMWRTRGLAQASLNSPMTAMRKGMKGIPLTERNTWINPQTQEKVHIALKYMNYSKEEWDRIKATTSRTVLERMEEEQFLDEPEVYVQIVRHLLAQESWPELAVGVLAATGRRLSEGLKTAVFQRETDYTVLFTGQLKQPLADLPPYEIPLLVSASLLLSSMERLRTHPALKECTQMDVKDISHRYGPKVRVAARAAFEQVVPVRADKQQLAVHDLRALYARIAVHWYCPPRKDDRLYASTILGHQQGAASEAEALERLKSEEHYADYHIGDGKGNVNGAKGIKLGELGVVVLKAFQPKPVVVSQVKERKGIEASPSPEKTKRPARPTLHVDAAIHERVAHLKADLGLSSMNDAVEHLLRQHEVLERSREHLSPERLDLPAETVEKIRVAMEQSPELTFQDFLSKALVKEANIRIGTAQRYKDIDLTQMRTSELDKQQKSPALTEERIRRAVITLMLYNQQQADPKLRASLTQNAVHDLIGGRFDNIRMFLETHQAIITSHHHALAIPEKRSASVKLSALVIPDEPEAFGNLFLSSEDAS